MSYKRRKISERDRCVAAEILTSFMFTRNIDEVMAVWNQVYEQYGLCDDPFTHTPCSPKEWSENLVEYEQQTMMNLYGHCDGLEEKI